MSGRHDLDTLLREWSDLGGERLPERFLNAALLEVETVPQQRGGMRLNVESWPAIYRFVATGAAAAALALGPYIGLESLPTGELEATPSPPSSGSPEATAPSPREVAVGARLELGGVTRVLRSDDDALWAAVNDSIVRIDPVTEEVRTVLVVPDLETACADCRPTGLWSFDVYEGSAWVNYHREDESVIRRFDLETGAQLAEIALGEGGAGGGGADDVVAAFDSIWVVMCHSLTVARIDPATNKQIALVDLGLASGFCPMLGAISADSQLVWAGVAEPADSPNVGVLVGIDPVRNEVVATIRTGSPPCGGVVFDGTTAWAASCPDTGRRAIQRIDTAQQAVTSTLSLDGFAGDPVRHAGTIWVPVVEAGDSFGSGPGLLLGLDPRSGASVDSVVLGTDVPVNGRSAAAAIVAFDSLWVSGDAGTLLRIPLSELER